MELRKTPLNDAHRALGAKMVDFGGWDMPVQYTGIIEEHNAVRNGVGLFDVSHMGEVEVNGDKALEFVQYLVTNDVSKISEQQILYSPMCNENAGIIDDLLVYKRNNKSFLIVVNASNIEKDFNWMKKHNNGSELKNISDDVALLALQGPKAEATLHKLTSSNLYDIKYYWFKEINVDGYDCTVSRTGYTGEDGFEIFIAPESAEKLWNSLLHAGNEFGIKPCGLGARDTLRLEAGLMLYGNDMNDETTPYEVPLKWTVKPEKEFCGRKTLLENAPKRKLVGFELAERAVPRHGNEVYVNGEKFDYVTSGTFSPTFGKPIGFCFVPVGIELGGNVQIRIRDKLVDAKTCSTRFYRKK